MNLREIRKKLNISQNQVAADIGCTSVTISNIDNVLTPESKTESYRHYLIAKLAEHEVKSAYNKVKHFDEVDRVEFYLSECKNLFFIQIVTELNTVAIESNEFTGLFNIVVLSCKKPYLLINEILVAFKIIDALNCK